VPRDRHFLTGLDAIKNLGKGRPSLADGHGLGHVPNVRLCTSMYSDRRRRSAAQRVRPTSTRRSSPAPPQPDRTTTGLARTRSSTGAHGRSRHLRSVPRTSGPGPAYGPLRRFAPSRTCGTHLHRSMRARKWPRPTNPQAAARPRNNAQQGAMANTRAQQNRKSEASFGANTQLWITPLLAFGTLRPGSNDPFPAGNGGGPDPHLCRPGAPVCSLSRSARRTAGCESMTRFGVARPPRRHPGNEECPRTRSRSQRR
jgi:hypothetical protein